ncbi:MAG: site-specific recombinase, invertase Pin [Hyphomicrobiales bacterium]|nr:site-specific recombinase, invertase Pin [Hyphomicrobiales bacterium]
MVDRSFVAYYRIHERELSGSVLGAQQETVRAYLGAGGWKLIAEVVEVKTGKRSERSNHPKLGEALLLCRVRGATLIIGELGQLARNLSFLSILRGSGVEFVALDLPQVTTLTLPILEAVARAEAKTMSERVKVALKAAEGRGVKLSRDRGKFILLQDMGRKAGVGVRAAKAAARNRALLPFIEEIRAQGGSLRAVAAELNARGIPAPSGGQWQAPQVLRVIRGGYQAS